MKHSKICFGFISVVGLFFRTIFVASNYLRLMDAINIFASLTNEFLFVFLFDGIAFLTIGVIVIGRLQVEGDKGHLHVPTREHERIHGFGAKF